MKWFLVTTLLIAGLVWCHDDVLNNLQDHLPELPDENELQEKSEDIEKVVRDKCVKAGGEKAFEELQIEKEAVTTCFQNLVDTEQIQAEIEEAKKTGSMDEVFAKYCKKKPEFLSCFNNFTNKLDQCLVEGEKTTLKIGVNLTETLIDFACYKDGDRLAMFIAEGGQECLTDKKDVLQDCFNKTMKSILPSDISMENIPLLVIGETECRAFTNLQTCFVKELETCKDKTPANLMEALFKFIRKSLPCSTQQQQQSLTAGGGPQSYQSNFIRDKRQENEVQKLQRENEESDRFISYRLKMKCDRNSPVPEAYPSLNASFYNFLGCARRLFAETGETCDIKKSIVQNCLEKFIVDLKQCLSSDEDFLPQFLRDSINSALNYFCENNGQRLTDFRTSSGLQCYAETNSNSLSSCFQSLGKNKVVDGEMILKQSSLCEYIEKADGCITSYFQVNCPKDMLFTDLVHGSIQSLNAPCAACSMFPNSGASLLAGLILLYVRKLWS